MIANGLIEKREALAQLVGNLLDSGAAGDVRAAQTLIRYLDQALGKVEQNAAAAQPDEGLASWSREERARYRAWLEDQPKVETDA